MITAFAVFLVLHGLIHFLGFVKAFGLAELPLLRQPISTAAGICWLSAGVLFLATSASLFVWPRAWWGIGALALIVSSAAIASSWSEARFGMAANAIVAIGVAGGLLSQGPGGLRAAYARDVTSRVSSAARAPAPLVTEQELAHLPLPVQRYLRMVGVVGQPRVQSYRVRMHGRIRDSAGGRWMPLRAEQHNVVEPPARLFYFDASMLAIPVQGYHRYADASASMVVKAAALVPVVNASGPQLTQSETVTLFNDMCLLAPATLIDPGIAWETVDHHTVVARFSHGGHTVRSQLSFNGAGALIDFVSDDRLRASAGGTSMERLRWSTPVRDYRRFGEMLLAGAGEARWHEPRGDYAYIEMTFDDVEYNP
jgi:hypothetical protein